MSHYLRRPSFLPINCLSFLTAGIFASLLFAVNSAALADPWPAWRGPHRNGICDETDLPVKWDAEENIAWKVPMPGPGGSTPVIWGDSIFLTSARGEDLIMICVGTDGKIRWEHTLDSGNREVRGDEGNLASPSPSTDGKHVWAMVGTGILACFDFGGELVWQVDLQERYGEFEISFGMSSTPLLHEDHLYLQLLHSAGAWVIALEKETGTEVWKHNRKSDARAECEHSYASPTIYQDDKQAFLISHGADYTIGHKLENGEEIFRCGDLNPEHNYNPTLRFVSSPVAVPGLIVVPTAKQGPTVAIDPNTRGDVTEKTVWRFRLTADVPSPLIHDGLVYLCRKTGIMLCLDGKTGDLLYEESAHRQQHRASPVFADGKIYLTARDGQVTVIKAGKDFEILAENELDEPMTASPAISDGRIYLRTFENLYAVEKP
ncbi:Outer membrane biogenesis protein BamB [Planctomycetales bacterium 10988]|nr:Outer membrane biogenesis protein BamB [Planctomycetales bacterium 10988]